MDLCLLIGVLGYLEKQKCQNVAIAVSFPAPFCLQKVLRWEGRLEERVLTEGLGEVG